MTLFRCMVALVVVVLMVMTSVESFNMALPACSPNICAVVSCLRPQCTEPNVLRNGSYCRCCPVCVREVGETSYVRYRGCPVRVREVGESSYVRYRGCPVCVREVGETSYVRYRGCPVCLREVGESSYYVIVDVLCA